MSRPIAVVVSSYEELPTQRYRASGNFSTVWFGKCDAMDVEVTVDGIIDKDITFGMAIDKDGDDDLKYSYIKNGSRIAYHSSNTFYITNAVNPKRKNFMVRLFPV